MKNNNKIWAALVAAAGIATAATGVVSWYSHQGSKDQQEQGNLPETAQLYDMVEKSNQPLKVMFRNVCMAMNDKNENDSDSALERLVEIRDRNYQLNHLKVNQRWTCHAMTDGNGMRTGEYDPKFEYISTD